MDGAPHVRSHRKTRSTPLPLDTAQATRGVRRGGGGGEYSFVASLCSSYLTIGHALRPFPDGATEGGGHFRGGLFFCSSSRYFACG